MAIWLDLASDARKATNRLIMDGHHRSAISRAYYAVYSKVTHELISLGVPMPQDREGPAHGRIRMLIEKNLIKLPKEKREALSQMVGSLYAMRVFADYRPGISVDPRDVREAASLMKKCFDAF